MAKTISELTADLLSAPSACKEIKEVAQNYLDTIGKDNEAEAAKAYVAEMEADIMPIDGLIAFAESDMGAKVFWCRRRKERSAPCQRAQSCRREILRLPGLCSL